MNKRILWTVVAVIILILIGVGIYNYADHGTLRDTSSSTASSTEATNSTPAIPGNNLTLGEDATSTSSGKFLIAYNGMALYADSQDSVGKSVCIGACTNTWKPYIVTDTSNLVGEYPINGIVATLTRDDGTIQVTYNGQPLYFYAGDQSDDDIKGVGIDPVWTLARP